VPSVFFHIWAFSFFRQNLKKFCGLPNGLQFAEAGLIICMCWFMMFPDFLFKA